MDGNIRVFKLVLFSLYCMMTFAQFTHTYNEFLKSNTKNFGLLIYAEASPGQKYDQIKNQIENYAKMTCQQLREINVVWNLDISPEKLGLK